MTNPRVRFSGTDQGLLIRLEWNVPVPQLLVELEERLQQSRDFFDGSQALLEIGRQPVLVQDIEQLAVVLSRYGVTLRGVSPSPADQQRLLVAPAAPNPYTMVHFERRTVRSGEKIASEGHLFITGDVNPGAEVIAGYNIFVWGSLKGSAYAGVPDHEAAVIAALHLAPIQLRIAGYIARAPEARSTTVWRPELARIDDHAIVVEAWERGRAFQKRG